MRNLLRLFFAFVVIVLSGVSARAEDAFYSVALKDLKLVDGKIPEPKGDAELDRSVDPKWMPAGDEPRCEQIARRQSGHETGQHDRRRPRARAEAQTGQTKPPDAARISPSLRVVGLENEVPTAVALALCSRSASPARRAPQ